MVTRIDRRFSELRRQVRPALITFVTAGDPDYETSLSVLKSLPAAGADIVELGMPFSDPMADGPAIQAAGLRALKGGQTMQRTFEMVRAFRMDDRDTPLVLMGYYNPIYSYGNDRFLADARDAGVDGLIVVDLPPEEDGELCIPAMQAGLNFIRLATPTTDARRLPAVLKNTSGFVYYVAIAGITGTKAADSLQAGEAVDRIKVHTDLPVVVGFGVSKPEQAAALGRTADGVVVGSAIVRAIGESLDASGRVTAETGKSVTALVESLAQGVRAARLMAAE